MRIAQFRTSCQRLTIVAACLTAAGCSNSQPQVSSQTTAPVVAASAITIQYLDSTIAVSGSCTNLGELDGGFEINYDGSWIPQTNLVCTNGAFSIPIAALGTKLGFKSLVSAASSVKVRQISKLGLIGEASIAVNYQPNLRQGRIAEGGGIVTTLTPKYLMRGGFSGVQKEVHLTSAAHRYSATFTRIDQ